MRAFWNARVQQKAIHEVKHAHAQDRQADRAQRWQVAKNVRNDGVTSNLFPIRVEPATVVHRYDLVVTRKDRAGGGGASPSAGTRALTATPERAAGAVSPNRAWKMFGQLLGKFPHLPPLVRVASRVYTAGPLTPEMCSLPPELLDLSWQSATLKRVDSIAAASLPPLEQRQLLNKLLLWAINMHATQDGNFSVVRDHDGKIVCGDDGISVSGLRIFKGTVASVLFVDANESLVPAAQKRQHPLTPRTEVLRHMPCGVYPSPLEVVVLGVRRKFTYKDSFVQVFDVADASGTTTLTLWGYAEGAMKPDAVYVLQNVTVKQHDKLQPAGNLDHTLNATAKLTHLHEKPQLAAPAGEQQGAQDPAGSVQLALRLDTKCTVASEKSLWEEIKQHFGEGPYDEERQRRITRAVQGTPVVLSTSMKHTVVRLVRYNCNPRDMPMDPAMRTLLATVEPNQPYAVLTDYSVVPLQLLHCCFDPRLRSWTDITVPACSFFPSKRVAVLDQFIKALASGLNLWGMHVDMSAYGTKNIAVLDSPKKAGPDRSGAAGKATHAIMTGTHIAPIAARPSTILIVAMAGARTPPAEREKCIRTAQSLAKHLHKPDFMDGGSESDALRYVDTTLLPLGELRDRNAVVLAVSSERQTRASRWFTAECIRRGILPLLLPGVATERARGLLHGNIQTTMAAKFGTDPLRGVDIKKEVPIVTDRRILIVGIDACHTHDVSTGAVIGTLVTPHGNFNVPAFWRNDVRGQEVEQVTEHFSGVLQKAIEMAGGLDEVVVFQDGNVFSELEAMRARVPRGCGMTLMCLHKRTNIRFVHKSQQHSAHNVVKGCVVQSLAPVTLGSESVAPSFYLQSHDCDMSTARTVQYTVHAASPTLPIADIQRLSYVLSHVNATKPTKLPISTRCAHRLSSVAERLIDACPDFRCASIPEPLFHRLWFL